MLLGKKYLCVTSPRWGWEHTICRSQLPPVLLPLAAGVLGTSGPLLTDPPPNFSEAVQHTLEEQGHLHSRFWLYDLGPFGQPLGVPVSRSVKWG